MGHRPGRQDGRLELPKKDVETLIPLDTTPRRMNEPELLLTQSGEPD
jgi:hypothetical protein